MRHPLQLALTVLFAVSLFLACTLPTETKHRFHTQGLLHPWLHLGIFALLALLCVSSLRSSLLRLAALIALVLLGYLTEARESRWNHWPIEVNDVRNDAAGVAVGAMAGLALTYLLDRHRA